MKQAAYVAAALAAALVTTPALAQAPASSAPIPGFPNYGHPAIGAGDCRTVSPSEAQCVIPAKTAGRYVIDAMGTSTATASGAAQQIAIGGPNWECAQAVNRAPWSTGSRTFHVQCVVTILSDQPVTVNAIYRDTKATKDPKGPVLTVTPVPWNGILDVGSRGAK